MYNIDYSLSAPSRSSAPPAREKSVSSYASLALGPAPTYAGSDPPPKRKGGSGSWDYDDQPPRPPSPLGRSSYYPSRGGGRSSSRYDNERSAVGRGRGRGRDRNDRIDRFSSSRNSPDRFPSSLDRGVGGSSSGGGGGGGAYEAGEILPRSGTSPVPNSRRLDDYESRGVRSSDLDSRSSSRYVPRGGGGRDGGRTGRGGRGSGRFSDRGGGRGGRADFRTRRGSDFYSGRTSPEGSLDNPRSDDRYFSSDKRGDDRSTQQSSRSFPSSLRDASTSRGPPRYSSILGSNASSDPRSDDRFPKRRRDDEDYEFEDKRSRNSEYVSRSRPISNEEARYSRSSDDLSSSFDSRLPRPSDLRDRRGLDTPRGSTDRAPIRSDGPSSSRDVDPMDSSLRSRRPGASPDRSDSRGFLSTNRVDVGRRFSTRDDPRSTSLREESSLPRQSSKSDLHESRDRDPRTGLDSRARDPRDARSQQRYDDRGPDRYRDASPPADRNIESRPVQLDRSRDPRGADFRAECGGSISGRLKDTRKPKIDLDDFPDQLPHPPAKKAPLPSPSTVRGTISSSAFDSLSESGLERTNSSSRDYMASGRGGRGRGGGRGLSSSLRGEGGAGGRVSSRSDFERLGMDQFPPRGAFKRFQGDDVDDSLPGSEFGTKAEKRDSLPKRHSDESMVDDFPTGFNSSKTESASAREEEEKKPRPLSPPPKGEPSGVMKALVRLLDLEASMEFAYAKHMQLVKKQKELKSQAVILADLPVGVESFKEDLEQLEATAEMYDIE